VRSALLVLVVVFAAACNQAAPESSQAASSIPTPITSVPSAPSPTTSQPEVVKVPKVVGLDVSKARTEARRAGIALDVHTKETSSPRGTVLSQDPAQGNVLPGDGITIIVAVPLPRIPNVVGKDVKVATRILDNAGFNVHVRKQGSSAPKDQVISQSPSAGTASHSGRAVSLTIAKPLPKPPAPSGGSGGGGTTSGGGGNCTPGYSPCLPLGPSDYDCAGGSGDGPAYTKPGVVYHVSGSDPYGLDADGDGQGCE
jgi:hypothetical protein